MMRWIVMTLVAAIGVQAKAAELTVRVSGDPGVRFSGTYTVVDEDGSRSSAVLEGTVPVVFRVNAACVAVALRKGRGAGVLRSEVLQGRRVAAQSMTAAAAGTTFVHAGDSGSGCSAALGPAGPQGPNASDDRRWGGGGWGHGGGGGKGGYGGYGGGGGSGGGYGSGSGGG